jgi:hypothetical protein
MRCPIPLLLAIAVALNGCVTSPKTAPLGPEDGWVRHGVYDLESEQPGLGSITVYLARHGTAEVHRYNLGRTNWAPGVADKEFEALFAGRIEAMENEANRRRGFRRAHLGSMEDLEIGNGAVRQAVWQQGEVEARLLLGGRAGTVVEVRLWLTASPKPEETADLARLIAEFFLPSGNQR